jgi:hypothetical protein
MSDILKLINETKFPLAKNTYSTEKAMNTPLNMVRVITVKMQIVISINLGSWVVPFL